MAQNNLGNALRRSVSERVGRRGSRRRSPPIARRLRSGRASGFRSTGRRPKRISAMRSWRWASGRAERCGWRRRSLPIAGRLRNARASGFRSHWAATFGSQGSAMMLIANRTNNASMAETRLSSFGQPLTPYDRVARSDAAAEFDAQLRTAQAICDRFKHTSGHDYRTPR